MDTLVVRTPKKGKFNENSTFPEIWPFYGTRANLKVPKNRFDIGNCFSNPNRSLNKGCAKFQNFTALGTNFKVSQNRFDIWFLSNLNRSISKGFTHCPYLVNDFFRMQNHLLGVIRENAFSRNRIASI